MTLNSSGQISMGGSTTGQSINLELGQSATAQVSLNDGGLRSLAGVPSGQISLNNFWGKAFENKVYVGFTETWTGDGFGLQRQPGDLVIGYVVRSYGGSAAFNMNNPNFQYLPGAIDLQHYTSLPEYPWYVSLWINVIYGFITEQNETFPAPAGGFSGAGYYVFRNVGTPNVNQVINTRTTSMDGNFAVSGLSGTYGGARWGLVIGLTDLNFYQGYAYSPNITTGFKAPITTNNNIIYSYVAQASNGGSTSNMVFYNEVYNEEFQENVTVETTGTYSFLTAAINILPV